MKRLKHQKDLEGFVCRAVLPSFLTSLSVQDGGLVTCGSPQVNQSFQYYRIFRLIFRSFCGISGNETGNIFKKSRKDFLRHFSGFLWLSLFGSN